MSKITANEHKLAVCLQELIETICGGERDVTLEDCDDAKFALQLITGKNWDDKIPEFEP
jgi:hypothetical protein